MTMGRNIVGYLAAIAINFVCMGLYPISAEITPKFVNTNVVQADVGSISIINCTAIPETANITWLYNGAALELNDRIKVNKSIGQLPLKDKDGNVNKTSISTIYIANSTQTDAGNYTCSLAESIFKIIQLDLSFGAELVNVTKGPILTRWNTTQTDTINFTCVFKVYNVSEVTFRHVGGMESINKKVTQIGPKHIESTYTFRIAGPEDNGTYVCEINDTIAGIVQGTVDVIVRAPPKLTIDDLIAVNTTELYLNWTVLTYNCEINSYTLSTKDDNVTDTMAGYRYLNEDIGKNMTSYLISGLKTSHFYRVILGVKTDCGEDSTKNIYNKTVSTLDKEPIFVPNISINGFSATSVTIGWAAPPPEIAQFIHYYLLTATKKDEKEPRRAYHSQDGRNLPYMFDNLEPHSTYVFQVCACSDYTKRCGDLSEQMEAATLDGTPSKPSDVVMACDVHFVNLTWAPPERPNAEIKGYSMELTGNSTYLDRYGKMNLETWGPHSKFTTNDTKTMRFDKLQPNTNYTVKVSAMTRTRRRGEEAVTHCTTRHAPPDVTPRPRWRKIYENDKYMFKMIMPRASERNGPICCYRVYMVRLLPHSDWRNLPSPKDVSVLEYKDAHAQPPALGAYITDIFSNTNFPPDSELVMGDGNSTFDPKDPTLSRRECLKCLKKPKQLTTFQFSTTSSTTSSTTAIPELMDEDEEFSTEDPVLPSGDEKRERRSYDREYQSDPTMLDKPEQPDVVVVDGPLDPTANYTLFVELITGIPSSPAMHSDYLNVLMPAATPVLPQPPSALEIALQATCAVAALILLLMIIFCIRQTRRSRKMPPHAHLEMDSLPPALRCIPWFRRPMAAPAAPPDMAPIAKEDLPKAYLERQADSDYGFQKEFELLQMLPECFTDRTTHASETRENQPKNRYPDIKAYDQTRVKLAQIDGITGSDYINANYVMGYQERKQFICAQGPTDTTVNDFWRMIWEQGLELIVMLTNLEEYSKVKCSKYWPDESRGSRAFGAITVHHVSERRYSDYIVRELRITKQATTADGQPIVENGGAKRNGDLKEATDGSAPTSPRDRDTKECEGRLVRQYHFLMWKDFAAPEHAYSILKFIKRVNEACAAMVGVSCVVHCSAGVGRTGTLVALDCLLQQLAAQAQVAVFNTVAELRRQRNFLVQSLKQYVFVYRALVEFAHYGDTEVPACRLRSTIDRLRSTPPHQEHSLLEAQFQKIQNSPIPEPVKSCTAGSPEEVASKNRSSEVLPYDKNRVILAQIVGRDYSTYINASFIEAYDNSESFIITQDPLQNTIMDFWRMVSEHNVTTIVMLSELGEGKCPRYWDDGTAQYEHISVQYEESESCPYYTRRQFRVVNNKSGCVSCVRQLQYHGWPTAPGHVPEVTRGLADLADAAAHDPDPGLMLVHCQLGTERSSLFVALCILICQLRTERRVDVCSVARKVRDQRGTTIDTFLQYEFLHRAILNYAELHNLLEDG